MRPSARTLIFLGGLGVIGVGWLLWAAEHTEPPSPPVLIANLVAVVGLAVGPWLLLAARQLRAESEAGPVFWRVVLLSVLTITGGLVAAAIIGGDDGTTAVMMSFLIAGALGLVGAVLLPWVYVLTRAVTRERAARVRAEERAAMAAHLHDSVLQALTLIQKRTADPAVFRLARGTERELRSWLYGSTRPGDGGDDFAAAVGAVAAEVEDRFAMTVDLVAVGTYPLDERACAVVGAVREALANAAKHAQVRRVSVFAEVADDEMLVLVRDRGRGFDRAASNGPHRHGITDSIEARVHRLGGTAAIRTAVGEGTEVELRMPLAAPS